VNVPSFGDWGFTLAWRDGAIDDIIDRFAQGGKVQNATFITPQIAWSSLNFGRGELDSEFSDVNTLMRPVLLDRYLRRGWSKN
jgi:predicted membrane-bound spermidine synthase